ncbi:MAG: hypothetical protein H7A23_10670 [Leptospiraceae bacterium]|nr:hypothetical protein [Leptospiraceae bacterium]MCP5495008.1 hypothetical protein [Leptospiraceae bacterium]
MSKIIFFFLLLFCSCSTVEFIPNSNYSPEFKKYKKKDWSEVEVIFDKPQKPVEILGTIVIRNFNGDLNSKNYQNTLKKELFKNKMDGVWIHSGKITEVEPFVFQTQNQDGLTLAYYKANKEIGKIIGIPYRYK